MQALITGSGGLIGSACARVLCREGWAVVGIDKDMRAQFCGPAGTTRPVVEALCATLPHSRHSAVDMHDQQGVGDLLRQARPACILHTAAQPSHDQAAAIPYDDFDVHAVGTLKWETCRRSSRFALLALGILSENAVRLHVHRCWSATGFP